MLGFTCMHSCKHTQSTQTTQRSRGPGRQGGKHKARERCPFLELFASCVLGGGRILATAGKSGVGPADHVPEAHTGYEWKERGHNTCPSQFLSCPPPAGVVGLIPGRPSTRPEASTDPFPLTSGGPLPSEVSARTPTCPELGLGLWCGQEKHSCSCPFPSFSPLPGGPGAAAHPPCPSSMALGAPTSGMRTL